MTKRHRGATYLFAVAMRGSATTASFSVVGLAGEKSVEVLGENRTIPAQGGSFKDHFEPWDAHLYRVVTEPMR